MTEEDKSKNKNPLGSFERVPALDSRFVPEMEQEQRARKRGRPPLMLSSSSSAAAASPRGRGRGRPRSPTGFLSLGGGIMVKTGHGLIPHVFTVNTGQDVAEKISKFVKSYCQTVCVVSATGFLSSVVLGKPCSSRSDTLRCEGRFVILSLTGTCTFPGEDNVIGSLNISLAGYDGSVFGGTVEGPMIAATPVDLVLASFKVNLNQETFRRHTTRSSAVADLSSNLEMDVERVPQEDLMAEGKRSSPSPTSGLLRTADKPPENITAETSGKLPENDIPATTDKPQEKVTSETTDQPPENITVEASDKPPENVDPATTDKSSENVTPATTDKSPENVTAAATDTPPDQPPDMSCQLNCAPDYIPENLDGDI